MDSSGRGMPRVSLDDVYLAPVHLNVGGTTYTTTLDTLTRYPDSKIAKLFNGTLSVPVDSINNHYFLDVNGSVFAHILDFLRYKELILPEGFNQLQLLKKQAEYFEIEAMVDALAELMDKGEIKPDLKEDATIIGIKKTPLHKKQNKEKPTKEVTVNDGVEKCIEKSTKTKLLKEFTSEVVEKTNAVVKKMDFEKSEIVCVEYGSTSICIYSCDHLALTEPFPEIPKQKSKINGIMTQLRYDFVFCNYGFKSSNYTYICTFRFINQLLDKGYFLSSVTSDHKVQRFFLTRTSPNKLKYTT